MLDSQHHSSTLLNSDQYFPPVLRLKVPDIPLFSVYGLEELVKILSQNMIGEDMQVVLRLEGTAYDRERHRYNTLGFSV